MEILACCCEVLCGIFISTYLTQETCSTAVGNAAYSALTRQHEPDHTDHTDRTDLTSALKYLDHDLC